MTDMLAAERIAAQRFLQARRAQLAEASVIDEYLVRYARALAAAQPRCDNTVAQLPTLSTALSTDIVPIFHNGDTYGITVSNLVLSTLIQRLTTQANVKADGSQTTVSFAPQFKTQCNQILFGVPREYSGSDNAALSVNIVKGSITIYGFTVIVAGGQSGTTCSLDYLPFGT